MACGATVDDLAISSLSLLLRAREGGVLARAGGHTEAGYGLEVMEMIPFKD